MHRGFVIAVVIHLLNPFQGGNRDLEIQGFLWDFYGISIALAIRSLDHSLSVRLILQGLVVPTTMKQSGNSYRDWIAYLVIHMALRWSA